MAGYVFVEAQARAPLEFLMRQARIEPHLGLQGDSKVCFRPTCLMVSRIDSGRRHLQQPFRLTISVIVGR